MSHAGTTSYFTATAVSSIAMTHVYAEEISVTAGYAVNNFASPAVSSTGSAWVLPAAAPAGSTPRQVRALDCGAASL
jgi:hypothetical protein